MEIKQMNEWMWTALKASIEAGKAILEVYHTEFDVISKEDSSPLTQADLASHYVISNALEDTGLPVLSEEGKDIPFIERSAWEKFWLVDPLDGTKEFVNRNGEFTVNIALIQQGYPIAGIIYIPVTDEAYIGIEGKGAYKFSKAEELILNSGSIENIFEQGNRLPMDAGNRPYTVVGSRSHMSAETEAYIEELRANHEELEFSSRGSSLKLCMVAEGKADIYPRFAPTMEWDTAAGQAIAECSGASVVQSLTMERVKYNKENLLNPWFIVKR
jgi:3'(2'), 5'-bisphosphate nucleotidase